MTATTPRATLARLLEVDEVDAPELPISWNVAPTQPVYAVATRSNGTRCLRALRWGLVPSWAQSPAVGAKLINARAETLTRRPAFRSLVERRRALVPASGFYEWRRPGPGDRNYKQPYFFHRPDGGQLAFAGLWDLWHDAEGRPIRSCTIITTSANETMMPVHHRMPLVLGPENWDEWLRPGPLGRARLAELAVPAPVDMLIAYPVGSSVNKALNDGPSLIEPQQVEPQLVGPQLARPDDAPCQGILAL